METKEFLEGHYITVELVKDSPSKKSVVLTEAKGEETKFGNKLTCNVEIDGKEKVWRMNRDSVKNMRSICNDSFGWIGATVNFRIVSIGGKDSVVGIPEMKQAVTENVEGVE